jgi:hypothetical protein
VFNEVTANDYHGPPRWLNEGIATFLSEGYGAIDQLTVTGAAANGTLIPLDGLAGFFPSPQEQFNLAYAESVSAVDFFTQRYGEQALWDLVRSYASGQSDDDAFVSATGADVAAFNADWFGHLGAQVRAPFGPQPAPPGPVPDSWQVDASPSAAPGSPDPSVPAGSQQPQSSRNPARSVAPARPPSPAAGGGAGLFTGIAFGTLALVLVIAIVFVIQFSRRRRPYAPVPPQPWEAAQPWQTGPPLPPPQPYPPYEPYQPSQPVWGYRPEPEPPAQQQKPPQPRYPAEPPAAPPIPESRESEPDDR